MIEQISSDKKISKIQLLDNIAFFILLAVGFLVPLFFIPSSYTFSNQFGTSLFFGLGVVLASLVWIGRSLSSGYIDLPVNRKILLSLFGIVPLVYFLVSLVSGFSRLNFFGYTFEISTVGFIVFSFIYMYLVSVLFDSKNRLSYAFAGFIISVFAISLFLISRFILGTEFLSFGVFVNLTDTIIGSWNNLGIFYGISALMALFGLEILALSKKTKIFTCVLLGISLFFISLVNFTLIWIILAVFSLSFIVCKFYLQKNNNLIKPIQKISKYSLVVFVVSITFVIFGGFLGVKMASMFDIVSVDVRPSFSVTTEIGKEVLSNNPIFGSGVGNFTNQWLYYKPADIVQTPYWNADFSYGVGLLPTFVITTGIVGVISWILFFVVYLSFGVKALKFKYEDQFLKFLSLTSFGVSLYLWIMAVCYVPSTVIFILTLLFTGLFFASASVSGVLPFDKKLFASNPRTSTVGYFALTVIFIAVVFTGYGLFRNSVALAFFQKSTNALNIEGDIIKSEELMVSATKTVNYDIFYRALSEIRLIKLEAILSQNPEEVNLETAQAQFDEAFPSLVESSQLAVISNPSNYLNWITLGQAYAAATTLGIEGSYESAMQAFSEAFARNPGNPGIFLILSRLEINRGELADARVRAMQAIQMKPNYLDAYYLLTQIEIAGNNLSGAIDSVTVASSINSTDPNIFFQLGLLKYYNNDFSGAAEALEKSISLAPEYANAKYFLGLSFERLGRRDEAIALFEELARLNPENEEVKLILSNLIDGNPIFESVTPPSPDSRGNLPIEQ